MIIPVGNARQELVSIHRTDKGYEREPVLPVAFVPMTGEAQGIPRPPLNISAQFCTAFCS